MKNKNMYIVAGQLSAGIGVLLRLFVKDSVPIAFISGILIGMSLVFSSVYGLGLRKDKTN